MSIRDPRKSQQFALADERARRWAARLDIHRKAVDIQVAWLSDYESATRIGLRIVALDRELRRSASAGQRRLPALVLPSPDRGGLAFRGGSPGSAELYFDLFGFVRDVVLSDPILILIRAAELAGAVGIVRGWFFPRDPLDRISGREALAVIAEYEKTRATPHGAEDLGDPALETKPGHTKVVASMANENGSRTIVTIEMDESGPESNGSDG